MKAGMAIVLAALLGAGAAQAQPIEPGARFELRRSYETRESTSDGGSGSSSGHSVLIEQVVSLRDGGIELIYDEVDGGDRRNWQLPVRVFKPATGAFELLNLAELEARVDPWLARWNWTREVCDKWGFTWTAFKVECDPQSALGIVESFNLWSDDLREGAPFHMEGLLGTPPVRLERSDATGSVYVVNGDLDPAVLRADQARSDVIVAQITGQPITEEQALANLAGTTFSGTVSIRFTVAPSGLVNERATQTETRTVPANGVVETSNKTTTLTRRALP